MNTKKSLLSSAFEAKNSKAVVKAGVSRKINLSRAIQLALASSMLFSGAADAVLYDHGPSDPIITFPQWYRDQEGTAFGLCRSASDYCFPIVADPAGFPGNIGHEAFYNVVEFVGKSAITGNDFEYRYLSGLEASYLPGPTPKHGDETVFARTRITFNFNDPLKSGTYTVIHPFGVHTFENVQATTKTNLIGGQAANFFTVDFGAGQGFKAPLNGQVGPFIKWDSDLPIIVGTEQFVGKPETPHTFTGSPFLDDQQQPQNYLKIIGPKGSNIGGPGIDFIQVNKATTVLGQLWTGVIAEPLKIEDAALTRTSGPTGKNVIDVWATSSANQRLIVTGEGMPSMQLKQTSVDNTLARFPIVKYHGHIEYANDATPAIATPAQIKVTNLSSVPVVNAVVGLTDVVKIKHATFNTVTGEIKVEAQSSDQSTKPKLIVQGIPGLPTAANITPAVTGEMTPCKTGSVEQCFSYILPADFEQPEKITVLSADGGTDSDQLLSLIGKPQNIATPPVVNNIDAEVFTAGTTELFLPSNAIIIQPASTGIVKQVAGTQWVFTPKAGTLPGTDSFSYVTKSGVIVSNVAKANLTISFRPSAATGVEDKFAAQTGVEKTFNVLANDVVSSADASDALIVTTISIVNSASKGDTVVNPDGTISYIATSTGVDSFTYTVKTQELITSAPTTVTVTNFSSAEQVTVAPKATKDGTFRIDGGTTWFGASFTNQTITCFNGVATDPLPAVIGSSPVDTFGVYKIVGGASVPAVVGSNIRCQSSYGGEGVGFVR